MITDNENLYELDIDVDIDIINKLIRDTLTVYDKNVVLNVITDKFKEYLLSAFSVTVKELSNYFDSQSATNNFIEAMKFHGYFVKYHTTLRITEELRELLVQYPEDQKSPFDIDEGLLFNDLLGFDAIKYLLSAKSFQKTNLLNVTELTKKKATKVLDFMIYEEYITRNGTTYAITNKFVQRSKQYEGLFEENKINHDNNNL